MGQVDCLRTNITNSLWPRVTTVSPINYDIYPLFGVAIDLALGQLPLPNSYILPHTTN